MKPISPDYDSQISLFYHGRSMRSVFRPGDCLGVQAARVEDLQVGDVVVYNVSLLEDQNHELVHRIVAITPGGLVTQGDGNQFPDPMPVTQEILIGQVTHFQRGGRTFCVLDGRWGILYAHAARLAERVIRLFRQGLSSLAGRPYRWLRQSGLVIRLWRPPVQKVELNTKDGLLVKYVCWGRTVARWWPEMGRFECRKPYDLVLWGELELTARQADWTLLKNNPPDTLQSDTIPNDADCN